MGCRSTSTSHTATRASARSGRRESTFVTAHTTRVGAGYLETRRHPAARRPHDRRRTIAPARNGSCCCPSRWRASSSRTAIRIGERVVFALAGNERQTYTVVGVTADLVSTQMGNPRPQLFVSLAQHPASTVLAIARGASADPSMRRAFENAFATIRQPLRKGSAQAGGGDVMFRDLITGEDLIDNSYSDLLTQVCSRRRRCRRRAGARRARRLRRHRVHGGDTHA